MRKIKKIATGGIVGTLLFVGSNTVKAQDTVIPTRTTARNEISDVGAAQGEFFGSEIDLSTKDALFEQGFNPSQIQKLSRWGENY